MPRFRNGRGALPLALVPLILLLAACGPKPESGAQAGAGRGDGPATPAAALPPDDAGAAGGPSKASFAFSEADVAAFQRGFAREIELVKAAQERGRNAKTPEERARAAQESWEEGTAPGGAQAAGVPPERYRATRATIVRVLETLDFQGKIEGPMEMDRSRASPEALKRLDGDPFAELPPASAAALRARLPALVPLWVEYINLTAVGG